MTLLGLQLTDSPVDGDEEVERVTVPVKPLRPDTVVVIEPVLPEGNERLDGLVVRLKSGV